MKEHVKVIYECFYLKMLNLRVPNREMPLEATFTTILKMEAKMEPFSNVP